MSSEVVDLHICICIRTSHYLYLCTHRLHAAVACCTTADPPTQFSGSFDLFPPVCYRMMRSRDRRCVQTGGVISQHFSSQTLLNKDRQCCEFWRNAKLGVRVVCVVGDTTDDGRWVDLLCCSPHCDTAESCLMNDMLATFSMSSDCYDDWRWLSPTVCRPSYDASSLFCRCHLLLVTMCLLLSACC